MKIEEQLQKYTDGFSQAVGKYLVERFKEDKTLEEKFNTKQIDLNQVRSYVLKTVRNSKHEGNSVVMTDAEVFDMVVHFILDEDNNKYNEYFKGGTVTTSKENKSESKETKDTEDSEEDDEHREAKPKVKEFKKAVKKKNEPKEDPSLISLFDGVDL